jgi:hypothetical protein
VAVWNNPEVVIQAKANCEKKAALPHALLNSSVELK